MPRRPAKRRNVSSWRKTAITAKFFRRLKIFLFSFLCLAFLGLIFWSANALTLLKVPFASAGSAPFSPDYNWNSKDPLDILILDETTGIFKLLHVTPDAGSYVYVGVPITAKSPTEAKTILIEKLAVNPDRYLRLITPEGKDVADLLLIDSGGYAKFLMGFSDNFQAILSGVESDLTASEFARLSVFMKSAKEGSSLEMSDTDFNDAETADSLWSKVGFSKTLRQEGRRVMVLNASKKPGLAGWGTRIATNLGVPSTDPQNSNEAFQTSEIVYTGEESETLKALSKSFNIKQIVLKENLSEYAPFAERADILVLLGVDKIGAI